MNTQETMTLIIATAILIATLAGFKMRYGSKCLIPNLGTSIELSHPPSPLRAQTSQISTVAEPHDNVLNINNVNNLEDIVNEVKSIV